MNKYREFEESIEGTDAYDSWKRFEPNASIQELIISGSDLTFPYIKFLHSQLEQAEKEKRELDEKLTNILWNDEIGYKTKVYRCKNLLKQIEA